MFRFSKLTIFILIVLSLVACSSVPSGVDKEFYNRNKEMALEIDKCFNDKDNCKLDNIYDDYLDYNLTLDENIMNEKSSEIKEAVYSLIYVYLGGSDEYPEYFNRASEVLGLNKKYEIKSNN